ncbi:predicted protein [Botrytis cinerea T4]|uniref:Uncharacterized protein n=1 Tax=Botryotinia fuckeliana (strain T4) TaxID=999810 RepID=G2YC10_BOTF4|nr:predicted protein [Botrytis cinerea T4]
MRIRHGIGNGNGKLNLVKEVYNFLYCIASLYSGFKATKAIYNTLV